MFKKDKYMKISFNLLKEFVEIPYAPEKLAEILTNTGLEVEHIEKLESVKGGLSGVVVGEVLSCQKHPDADKLKITEVSIGNETLQIVCGAPNVSKGQKVLVATVGCTLFPSPDQPFTIKKAKIRGVESNGMICAEDELGIGKDHDGIMILPEDTVPGTPAASYFKFTEDYIFEIGLTPNRADAMGHLGVARDIAAYRTINENKSINVKAPSCQVIPVNSTIEKIAVEVNSNHCLRYMGIRISGVNVAPSPEWLQQKLRALGVSPINNVVDVTNYVMRELGTPLHAFDTNILGEKIIIRPAHANEKLVTLDKIERKFFGGELLICDEKSPACIAGVMGGIESGVTENTSDIFLESAVFDMVSVRKTARTHGISSDSSFRFERGVDKTLTPIALERACQLILELAGGKPNSQLVDIQKEAYKQQVVCFEPKEINNLLGTDISDDLLESILVSLDFEVDKKHTEWSVKVPLYRIDVERTCDIAEEVLRIYGFNNVKLPDRMSMSVQTQAGVDEMTIKSKITEFLVANGFIEVMNNSLTKGTYFDDLSLLSKEKSNAVRLINPLSQELEFLRISLIPGLLENITYNQNRQSVDLKFFEFGKSYHKNHESYTENRWLTLAITGHKNEENWINRKETIDFYFVKGIAEKLLIRLGIKTKVTYNNLDDLTFSDGLSGTAQNKELIKIGKLIKECQAYFDIKNPVFFIEFNWDHLLQVIQQVKISFNELPKSFVVRRDFSLLLNKSVQYKEIAQLALSIDKSLLKNVNLFDVYEGEKLAQDKKSYAVSFHFQDGDRTLTDQEIDTVMERIKLALESKLEAQLR